MFNTPQVQTLNSEFRLEYLISLIIILTVVVVLLKKKPDMNIIVVIIIGLIMGYISVKILSYLMPEASKFSNNVYLYSTNKIMSDFNSTGYYHVWPPILAVLVVFIILLYNRQLG